MKKNSYWYPYITSQGIKKLLLTMKITLLLIIVTVLNVNASLYSQSMALDITVTQKSVKEVLKTIEKQSNFRFFYNEDFTDLNKTVSISIKDKNLEEVLSLLLDNSTVTYKILENDVVVITPISEMIQQQKITGKITDAATGEPLPGVNIVVDGTTVGVTSDIDGNYEIVVEQAADAVLAFSYIGYISEKVSVQGKSVINLSMIADVTKLDEVVVVGYGVQRKESVTGSVASIGGKELNEIPSANITQSLQGRVAGVEFSQTSSKPGASMQIRIRGTRSLTANNDPLVVLDGIPFGGSISDINPNDIKSVDILKDASATAIYGSRGANGVILITTNKGQKGQKAQITYNGYYGIKKVFAPYPMMDGPEFVALRTAANQYTNGVDEANDVNTNWQDLFYRPASVSNHDLSISGGTEKSNYSFGIGYNNDESVIPNEDYSRYKLRGSLDQEIGKYIRVGFTTTNNYSITNNGVGIYGLLSMSPIADPYNADGTWKRTIKMPLDEQWNTTRDIIENLGDKRLDISKAYASYNSLYGEVKIPGIEGLKYHVNVGLDYRQVSGGTYTGEGVGSSNPTNVSTASINNSLYTKWTIENLLTYDRTFAEKHQLNIVAMYSAEEASYNKSTISAKDIPSDAFQFYNLGRANGEITITPGKDAQGNYPNDYYKSGLMSYMGRAMYSYDNKYMLTATLRSDASSRLAEGHKWHSFPSVSVGWNIKNESFMNDVTILDMLKLRAGYGQTANQAVSPYSTLGLLDTRPYNFGDADYATGYYVSELPNTNLGWEYSETMNYGVDFSILNHRLNGTIEYYTTKTKDLLLRVGLPPTSGVSGTTANVGQTKNNGLEFSLDGIILDNLNGWTWKAGINLTANRNELVALASGALKDEVNLWFVGHPIDVIYDFEKVGLWQEGDPFLTTYEPGGNPGMIKVKYTGDYNTDGSPTRQIGPDDRQIIDLEPNFTGGFNTSVAYKGFDFSIIGAFRNGGTILSTLYSGTGYLNMMSGRRGNVKVDYWTPENTGAKYPKPGGLASGDNPKYASTLGLFDGSYLKIRTITLGYTFNQSWMKTAGVDKLRIYFSAVNPFVMFSPYNKESGMDPETNSYGDENSAVSAYPKRFLTIGTNTPSTRNYLFGISLTF